MEKLLVLATNYGVIVCQRQAAGWKTIGQGLTARPVISVTAQRGTILAGTRRGIFRSTDFGASWEESSQGLSVPIVRYLAFHPEQAGRVFAGSEPAAIFLSEDGGQTWRELPEIRRLHQEHGWYLPYSPEAGCIRGFAFSGSRAYAAAEVGGLLRSDDGGLTWGLAGGSHGDPQEQPDRESGSIHPDVHSVAVHPGSPDWVSAPTGGGFYKSMDGGITWDFLYDCYCRAVWLDPKDENHLVLGPARGVDRGGRIESSLNGGASWGLASGSLPVPWHDTMVERFIQVNGQLIAMLSDGRLLVAPVDNLDWQPLLAQVSGVNAVCVLEE